jgi:hypothetical protein
VIVSRVQAVFVVDAVEEEGEQVDAGELVAFGGVAVLALQGEREVAVGGEERAGLADRLVVAVELGGAVRSTADSASTSSGSGSEARCGARGSAPRRASAFLWRASWSARAAQG